MKFSTFLNENKTSETILVLKNSCQKYISLLKNNGIKNLFLRRVEKKILSTNTFDYLTKFNLRMNRKGHGDVVTFETMCTWLEKNNHVNKKNSVSAISKENKFSTFFGDIACLFFPIDDFNYTFVRARDFHSYDVSFDDYIGQLFSDRLTKESEIKFINKIKKSKMYCDQIGRIYSHVLNNKRKDRRFSDELLSVLENKLPELFETNKNIKEAFNNGYEIWFNCKNYYLLPLNGQFMPPKEDLDKIMRELGFWIDWNALHF